MSDPEPQDFFGPENHHWADPVDRHEPERFLDSSSNVKALLWGLTFLGLGLFLVDFFYHRHVIHDWEGLAGFYPVYGFVGIVVLVYGARALRRLVARPEDYYEDDAGRESGP